MEKSSESNISPLDAQQAAHGDLIALFVDEFDPPTVNHARAAEAFARCHDVKQVWIAPTFEDGSQRGALASILCADVAAATRRELAVCTVGLDKKIQSPDDLIAECRKRFPYHKFVAASIGSRFTEQCHFLAFRGVIPPPKAKVIQANDFLYIDCAKVRADIKAGKDQERNLPEAVWGHIQKKRIYR